MKKIIIIMTLALGPAFVHAQGWIAMYGPGANITTNGAAYNAGILGFIGPGAPMVGGAGAYDFALLFATSTTPGDSTPVGADWNLATLNGGGQLLGNNFVGDPGGMTGPNAVGGVSVNLAAGITYNVMLVGWSSNLGSSWSTITDLLVGGFPFGTSIGFFGNTGISTITPFSAASPGDPLIFPTAFSNGSMILFEVRDATAPEPTTLALAGLGGLSMLFLRRRKA